MNYSETQAGSMINTDTVEIAIANNAGNSESLNVNEIECKEIEKNENMENDDKEEKEEILNYDFLSIEKIKANTETNVNTNENENADKIKAKTKRNYKRESKIDIKDILKLQAFTEKKQKEIPITNITIVCLSLFIIQTYKHTCARIEY